MAAHRALRSPTSTWVAVITVALLAVGVGVLSFFAYERTHSLPSNGSSAAPAPTFTLGVSPASPSEPTSTPIPSGPVAARASERFLSVGAAAAWRATAGSCGGATPTIERSVDGGTTWRDVTPTYRGIAQIASLDAFLPAQAGVVAAVADACTPTALRTFTQGQFWESYPDVLVAARYVDLENPGLVHLAAETINAPCEEAHSLSAAASTVALLCAGTAYRLSDKAWVALPATNAVALAVTPSTLYVASTSPDCDGLALTAYSEAPPVMTLGCEPRAAEPPALSISGSTLYLWSGAEVLRIPAP